MLKGKRFIFVNSDGSFCTHCLWHTGFQFIESAKASHPDLDEKYLLTHGRRGGIEERSLDEIVKARVEAYGSE